MAKIKIDKKQFIGQKINRLTILKADSSQRVFCRCDCGNEKYYNFNNLFKNTKSCGCLRSEGRNKEINFEAEYYRWKKVNNPNGSRGIENSITLEQFSELIVQNCHYCGQVPNISLKYSKDFYRNGIDRKDNNLGYHLDNCVTACADCNMCKQKFSYDRFLEIVKNIQKHQKARAKIKVKSK